MPTILELAAGKDFVTAAGMDGKSLAGILTGKEQTEEWRDAFLNEYLSVGAN